MIFLLSLLVVFLQSFPNHARNQRNTSYCEQPVCGQIANEKSCDKKCHKDKCISQMTSEIFKFLLTAFGGIVTGVIVANLNRRNDAFKSFNAFIAFKKADLETIDIATQWEGFYNSSKTEIKEAVFKLVPYLTRLQRQALADIWRDYKSGETHQKLSKAISGGSDMLAYELEAQLKGTKIQNSKEEIFHGFFDKMKVVVDQGWRKNLLDWMFESAI